MIIERIILNEVLESVSLTAYIQRNIVINTVTSRGMKRPALIICPSGGYISLNEEESEYIAIQFLALGYQIFILNYSIGAPYAHFPAPFLDLSNAIYKVRQEAARYNIDPDKIVVCGLSTGGHVAAFLGTSWHKDLFTNKNTRPNAMILGYPVLDLNAFKTHLLSQNTEYLPHLEMLFSAVLGTNSPKAHQLDAWNCTDAVSHNTVPTFIWSYREDQMVHFSQIHAFTEALKTHQVNFKSTVYDAGRHGDFIPSDTHNWISDASNWLRQFWLK